MRKEKPRKLYIIRAQQNENEERWDGWRGGYKMERKYMH